MVMKTLPCGHAVVDSSGCFCSTCGKSIIKPAASLEKVREITEARGAVMQRNSFPEGLVKAAVDEYYSKNRTRRDFLFLFLSASALLVAGEGLHLSHKIKKEADTQKRTDWIVAVTKIESAIESDNKEENLSKLASEYRAAGSNVAAALCDAARSHLCRGEPLVAHNTYQMLKSEPDIWIGLPPRARRHVFIRYGKVSNNIGDHQAAAESFQHVVNLGLDETFKDRLATIREALNAYTQMLERDVFLHQTSSDNSVIVKQMSRLLKDAADTLKVNDIREALDSHAGLVPGIAMFSETVDYIRSSSVDSLKRHRQWIDEMIEVQKSTGWYRFSPYIALALARGHFDEAYEGLASALALLYEKPVRDLDVHSCALSIAETMACPVPAKDPGRIELALHLAMWGQYWWGLAEAQSNESEREKALPFFQAARTMLGGVGHRRFSRDLDSFLCFYSTDDIFERTGVPANVRKFGPPEYTTPSFFPLSPA